MDRVVLLVCPAVMEELSEREVESNDRKVRQRAAKALALLGRHHDRPEEASMLPGARVEFIRTEPSKDYFREHNLDRDIRDDRIIAHALCEVQKGAPVLIATNDFPMRVKATGRDIQCYAPGKELKLPYTKTPDDVKTEKRLQKLDELERSMPDLELQFIPGSDEHTDRVEFVLRDIPSLTDEKIQAMMAAKRQSLQYPRARIPGAPFTAITRMVSSAAIMPELFGGVSAAQIAEYRTNLEAYIENEYQAYITQKNEYDQLAAATISLPLCMVNRGTAPADDIDVLLCFPGGVEIVAEDELLEEPSEPPPPEKPEPSSFLYHTLTGPTPFFSPPPIPHPKPPPDVTGPNITRLDGIQVGYRLRRLKQGMTSALDPLYVSFPSVASAFNFYIHCRIIAANVSGETTAQLHVIVNNE